MFKYKGLKVQESDATLPKTRKELFKTMVKDDFYLLAEISMIIFLFSVLLIGAYVAELLMISMLADPSKALGTVCFYAGLIEIPLYGFRYIGKHAAFGVMKKRVHNEAGYIKELFFEMLKKGTLRGFLIGCLLGFVAFVWQIGTAFLLVGSMNTWLKGIGIGALTLFLMIFYAAVQYFLAVDNFYELKFSGALKNGFSFAIMHFPLSVLYFTACMVIPFLIAFFFQWWALILAEAVFALWLDGLSVLAVTVFSHSLFDKYINSVYYPEYMYKGLSHENTVNEKENDDG